MGSSELGVVTRGIPEWGWSFSSLWHLSSFSSTALSETCGSHHRLTQLEVEAAFNRTWDAAEILEQRLEKDFPSIQHHVLISPISQGS